jgi:hypothetical protein
MDTNIEDLARKHGARDFTNLSASFEFVFTGVQLEAFAAEVASVANVIEPPQQGAKAPMSDKLIGELMGIADEYASRMYIEGSDGNEEAVDAERERLRLAITNNIKHAIPDGYRLQPIAEYEAHKQYVEATNKVIASAVEYVDAERKRADALLGSEPQGWRGMRVGKPCITWRVERRDEWIVEGDVTDITPLYAAPVSAADYGLTVHIKGTEVYLNFRSRAGGYTSIRPYVIKGPGNPIGKVLRQWCDDRITEARAAQSRSEP